MCSSHRRHHLMCFSTWSAGRHTCMREAGQHCFRSTSTYAEYVFSQKYATPDR